ncbi:MAG: MAPEG family protein, partial [Gammaproteobacteria bacterium]|nr:MAPEG family protein [Gammaproteobacteria bacterium]
MLELKITVVVTALFAIMIVPLVSQITMRRIQLGNVAIGDANDFDLRKKIETLSNFCEYVPLGLIILALLELNYAHENYALVFGVLFLAARILHALGMLHVKA